ncbi:hypothetical protein OUZ56_018308 [Daphnia magna]|uniref:Uncharacterized protein n=1 Tax=Daphnia magna TaxID=35525 RepID=A0ABQ9Z8H5_9CRUS|nr:hypothetical protein OUZ56_018308 [Daphnia magna]
MSFKKLKSKHYFTSNNAGDVEDIENSEASTEDIETFIRGCNPAEEDWDEHWEKVVDVHIGSYPTLPSLCWNYKITLTSCYIRWLCCVKTFCPECDIQFLLWNAFHQRQLLFNVN